LIEQEITCLNYLSHSFQVYKGLSIATAKATSDERSQAPHHMLDIITPNEPFTVTHFRDKALPIVSVSFMFFSPSLCANFADPNSDEYSFGKKKRGNTIILMDYYYTIHEIVVAKSLLMWRTDEAFPA
jgi:tRNA dimethylallyltransferase